MTKKKFLSTKDLAERWGKTTGNIYDMRKKKTGPRYVRIGGSIRYNIADVEQYELLQKG